MKKILITAIFSFSSLISFSNSFIADTKDLYTQMQLNNKMDFRVFENAIKGYNKINAKNKKFLTIIDFTKPSTTQRFFVLDLEKKNILYDTFVTHGKNSGKIMAINFSNTINSYKSSLGFFVTDSEGYNGSNGYSLRLKGLEPGINSNAFARNIVVHGADYAKANYIEDLGFLGRSLGCPAIPTELSREVIDTIKNGTILFIAGNDEKYYKRSSIIGS